MMHRALQIAALLAVYDLFIAIEWIVRRPPAYENPILHMLSRLFT